MRNALFHLRPRAPFRLDLTAWALRRRPRNLIDRWDGARYSRILVIDGAAVHLSVTQTDPSSQPQIECTCNYPNRTPKPEHVTGAVERLLGLNVDMSGFERLARRDSRLEALVRRFVGFHPPRFPTVFEAAVNAICCQQLSLEVGLELLNRLSARSGSSFKGWDSLVPPDPRRISRLNPRELRGIGFSRRKADALLELARVFVNEGDRFEALSTVDNQAAMDALRQLKGIGRWSAEYILLRGLGRLNVFPGDDIAAAKNLGKWLDIDRERQPFGYDEIHQALEKWAPFQGLVYFHLLLSSLVDRGLCQT
jgi:DNA-3-methyladenine glycosylase II